MLCCVSAVGRGCIGQVLVGLVLPCHHLDNGLTLQGAALVRCCLMCGWLELLACMVAGIVCVIFNHLNVVINPGPPSCSWLDCPPHTNEMYWIGATSVGCFQLGGSLFNWLCGGGARALGSTFSAHSFQQFALRLAAVASPFPVACLSKQCRSLSVHNCRSSMTAQSGLTAPAFDAINQSFGLVLVTQ